jgi:threonine aldolase
LKNGIKTVIKQKGGLLAKGRALGIQFETLFENDLYLTLSKHAVKEAMRLKDTFIAKSIPLKYEAYTNQLFPILANEHLEILSKKYVMLNQGSEDANHTVVRICTSWATDTEQMNQLIEDINKL